MKTKRLRIIIPLAVLALAGIGFVAHTGFGNLSALGWDSVSLLCPLGALGVMLASKTMIPRAVISLVIAIVAIVLIGRAFCAWVCPVPVVSKLRTLFKKQDMSEQKDAGEQTDANTSADVSAPERIAMQPDDQVDVRKPSADVALSADEKKLLHTSCGHTACTAACSASERPSNSRHLVLGGALLSTAIFGFPVFCLICPIGLSFAFIFVLIGLFGTGDVTWSAILIPVVLLVEVVFFKKWCSHICPISAFMSLCAKANKTFRPVIDNSHCLEAHHGECGRCAQVCEVGIDPRHPERGADWSECTKCRACVDGCPGHAISMPFLPRAQEPLPDRVAASTDDLHSNQS